MQTPPQTPLRKRKLCNSQKLKPGHHAEAMLFCAETSLNVVPNDSHSHSDDVYSNKFGKHCVFVPGGTLFTHGSKEPFVLNNRSFWVGYGPTRHMTAIIYGECYTLEAIKDLKLADLGNPTTYRKILQYLKENVRIYKAFESSFYLLDVKLDGVQLMGRDTDQDTDPIWSKAHIFREAVEKLGGADGFIAPRLYLSRESYESDQ